MYKHINLVTKSLKDVSYFKIDHSSKMVLDNDK